MLAAAEIIARLKRNHAAAVIRRLVHFRRRIGQRTNGRFRDKQQHIVLRHIAGRTWRHSDFCFHLDAGQHVPHPRIGLTARAAHARKKRDRIAMQQHQHVTPAYSTRTPSTATPESQRRSKSNTSSSRAAEVFAAVV